MSSHVKTVPREFLKKHGLTDEEIDIYLTIQGLGTLTLGEIAVQTGKDINTVGQVLESLIKKGYVSEIKGTVPRYIALEPFLKMYADVDIKYAEDVDNLKKAMLQVRDEVIASQDSVVNQMVQEVTSYREQRTKEYRNAVDQVKMQVSEIITAAIDRNTKLLTEVETRTNQMMESTFNFIKESETSYASKVEEKIKTLADELNSLTETTISSHHTTIDSVSQTVDQNVTQLIAGISEMINELENDIISRMKELESQIHALLDAHVEGHKDSIEKLRPRIDAVMNRHLKNLEKAILKIKKDINTLLERHKKENHELMDRLKKKVSDHWTQHVNEYVATAESLKKDTATLMKELIEISQFLVEAAKKYNSRLKALKTLVLGRKNKFIRMLNDRAKRISAIQDRVETGYINLVTNYSMKVQQIGSNAIKTMHSDIDSTTGEFDANADALWRDADETIPSSTDELRTTIAEDIYNTLQKDVDHCATTSDRLKQNTSKTLDGHSTKYVKSAHSWETKINSTLEKHNSLVKNTNNKLKAELEHVLAEYAKTSSATFGDHIKEVHDITNENIGNINTAVTQLKTFVSEVAKSEINTYTNDAKNVEHQTHALMENNYTSFSSTLSSLTEEVTSALAKENEAIKERINIVINDAASKMDEIAGMLMDISDKLNEIYEVSRMVPTMEFMKSWVLVGREHVKLYIASMLSRVKSSIVVIMPVVDADVMQYIVESASTRQRQRFIVVAPIDPTNPNHRSFLQTALRSLPNVQFRTLQSGVWAATRDGEEVVIAPEAPDPQMVGIVSQLPEFAQLFGQVIGTLWQAKSRVVAL